MVIKNFFIFLCIIISISGLAQETTIYFFIRHAEKDISDPANKKNPELTEEGIARAKKWAEILSETKIDYVFSTDYLRTLQTAEPIAKKINLEIISYDPRNLNNPDFQKKTKGKTSVIVGHSNTTPSFVNKIIGQQKYAPLSEEVYHKLFIITIAGNTITDMVLNID